jgi:MYXO-CTERM domain-containing protein
MRKSSTLILATTLSTLLTAGAAHAHSEYVQYIPNSGALNCMYCHVPGDTTQLDPMGEDTLPHVGKPPEQWWPLLRGLDSDGDGQTNGQELGDPCEEWLIGLEPGRTTDISNPSDPASQSPTPDVPSCDPTPGTGGGGSGSGGGEGGGTPTTGNAGSGASGGTTSGAGSSGPSGGQGASQPASAGAGKADEPVLTNQNRACSTGPTSTSSGAALLFLAAAALLTARSRRHKTR